MTRTATTAPLQLGQDLEALFDLPNYFGWVLETFAPHLRGRVLEVGAGTGNLASFYLDRVDEAVLLEPSESLFPALHRRFAGRNNVRTVGCPLAEWMRPEHAHSFDAIVVVNAAEHFDDDRSMLRMLQSLLAPRGMLLLFVPALSCPCRPTDDMNRRRRRRNTPSELRRLFEDAGLERVELRHFDVIGALPWFVAGRLLRQRWIDPSTATTYDRLVIPVASRLERWLRLPFGNKRIALGRRPE